MNDRESVIDFAATKINYRAMQSLGPKRFKTIAVVAALAVLLGQFSLTLHDIVAQHDIQSACEVCVVKDRLADFVVASVAIPVFAAIALPAVFLPGPTPALRRMQAARPRGPPVS